MPLNRAHLVVRVDGKRPVSVVVMVAQTMVAELTLEEFKRMYSQIDRMEDHLHDEGGQ